eukprot:TRINITY_DN60749_c0_g2_i1.p1 TRINITY_DN60749_c0_g2~~TRINITY_DN60749_c0_g2_i1.p1  ORF type:complete len:311 (+),score=55.16 TRINITY_DN60749_c0_g2_i1:39-971(+)
MSRGFRTLLALLMISLSWSELSFMVMGDWGGMPIWPYFSPGEHAIAKSLGRIAGETNASFTLALGDNFYEHGVKNVDDPRFKQTFERVFTSPNLQHPDHFRLLAGNHDHYGNCSAQLAYTAVSSRWHFPDYYYSMTETVGAATVQFVMVDTVVLSGATNLSAETHWEWINQTLAGSTADFLLVAGHFPVWSICEHGPTSQLVSRLKPMLEAHSVTVYLSGHDHCAEHLTEGKGVEYHGIGAGILCDPSTKHAASVPEGALKWHYNAGLLGVLEGAFGHVMVSETGLVVTHYGSKGQVLYTAPAIPPREWK